MMKSLLPRYAHLLHGADYNPEQWLAYPGVLEEDIRLMKQANINCVTMGMFSWAQMEPQEGVFTLDWLARVIDSLHENGIFTILATPSGAKPYWLSEKYEEVRRVSENMERGLSGGRHNHCYTSPVYREKVKILSVKLARRFSGHPGVILWHLSNEYGGSCYCPLCQQAFRDWLKAKYQTLEALNAAWWTAFWSHTYTDWAQIHAPVPKGETCTHGLTLDWKRFTTAQVLDFMQAEIDNVRGVSPEIPVTTNFMYDHFDYNLNQLAQRLDVVSWDAYPAWHGKSHMEEARNFALWHDYMRSLKKQPFLLMESTPSATNWQPVSKLKKPRMHFTAAMQAVAHGSDSVQYFQFRKGRGGSEKFHGAVVDHNGADNTRVFRDVAEVGAALAQLSAGLSGAMPKPKVAVVYDTENRWALEGAQGPRNMGIHYMETIRRHYEAFWHMGIPVDMIDEECCIDEYSLVIAPMLYMLRAGFAEKLRAFVEKGGTLLSTYHSGIVDASDLVILGGWPGKMMDLFGIWNEEIDSLDNGEENYLCTGEESYPVKELCAIVHPRGAKVLGIYGADFYAGTPALTMNHYGAGKAYYLAASAGADFFADFYGTLARELGLEKALEAPLPYGVVATARESAAEKYVFLQNFLDEERMISLEKGYQNALTGGAAGLIELPAFGTVILKRRK